MFTKITAEASDELGIITDFVHDCWFDLDSVKHDQNLGTITVTFKKLIVIPQTRLNKWSFFKRRKTIERYFNLEVAHTKEYEINDTEKVGMYDFIEVKYNKDEKEVVILTGIPLDFHVRVEQFKISINSLPEALEA